MKILPRIFPNSINRATLLFNYNCIETYSKVNNEDITTKFPKFSPGLIKNMHGIESTEIGQ